jgi:hypothetical protein
MKRYSLEDGFETSVSMSFLVISVVLVASAATLIHTEDNRDMDHDLRFIQVGDMGRCILELLSRENPTFEPRNSTFGTSVFIWNGSDIRTIGIDTSVASIVGSVLILTPDNLWSIAVLTDQVGYNTAIDFEVAVFSGRTPQGVSLHVILPVHRTPIPEMEVFT